MTSGSQIAFKEWAVVVDALGHGEQVLILRKGGIHETGGQFRPEHRAFWLFPTKFHEEPGSVIPSKRPVLEALAAGASRDTVDLQYFAEVTEIHEIHDRPALKRLQGQHIWSEHVLEQRFEFGRAQTLFAMLVRVYRRAEPVRLPLTENYGGCKSWVELDQSLSPDTLAPVLDDTTFTARCAVVSNCLTEANHAIAHS